MQCLINWIKKIYKYMYIFADDKKIWSFFTPNLVKFLVSDKF